MSDGSPSQVWDHRWPSGTDEQIAILAVSVDTVARRFGFTAETWDEDGLGPARGFACTLPSGRVISLVEFSHRPGTARRGPNLNVDSLELQQMGGAVLLREALDALGLVEAEVDWVRPGE